MNRDDFVNRTVGLPWVDRAQSWDAMDCWGLVVSYYRHVIGVELPDVHSLDFGVGLGKALETGLFERVDIPPKHGLIFTAFCQKTGAPCHVGLVVDHQTVLHSNHGAGVRCDRIDLLKRIYGELNFYAYTGRTDRP